MLTKFKETGGLHSGRRSWAPTSPLDGCYDSAVDETQLS